MRTQPLCVIVAQIGSWYNLDSMLRDGDLQLKLVQYGVCCLNCALAARNSLVQFEFPAFKSSNSHYLLLGNTAVQPTL